MLTRMEAVIRFDGVFVVIYPVSAMVNVISLLRVSNCIWELNGKEKTGVSSGQAYQYLQTLPEKKSRASVIFFLNDMVDEGVLDYEEESGKGGYHKIYYQKVDRKQFAEHVTRTVTDKLHEVFQYQ